MLSHLRPVAQGFRPVRSLAILSGLTKLAPSRYARPCPCEGSGNVATSYQGELVLDSCLCRFDGRAPSSRELAAETEGAAW